VLAGIAVDGGNGICNGTCQDVPIALVKRQGRVAALDEEIEGWFVQIYAHSTQLIITIIYSQNIGYVLQRKLLMLKLSSC